MIPILLICYFTHLATSDKSALTEGRNNLSLLKCHRMLTGQRTGKYNELYTNESMKIETRKATTNSLRRILKVCNVDVIDDEGHGCNRTCCTFSRETTKQPNWAEDVAISQVEIRTYWILQRSKCSMQVPYTYKQFPWSGLNNLLCVTCHSVRDLVRQVLGVVLQHTISLRTNYFGWASCRKPIKKHLAPVSRSRFLSVTLVSAETSLVR